MMTPNDLDLIGDINMNKYNKQIVQDYHDRRLLQEVNFNRLLVKAAQPEVKPGYYSDEKIEYEFNFTLTEYRN